MRFFVFDLGRGAAFALGQDVALGGVFFAQLGDLFVAFLAQPQALSDFSNPKNRMYAMQKKTVMVAVAILATLLAGCGDKKSEPAPVAAPAAVTAVGAIGRVFRRTELVETFQAE